MSRIDDLNPINRIGLDQGNPLLSTYKWIFRENQPNGSTLPGIKHNNGPLAGEVKLKRLSTEKKGRWKEMKTGKRTEIKG